MSNYIIEDGFDFYKELYDSLDNSGNSIKENGLFCLITNEPLTEHFVELECKHTFNYIPLFKDLVNHKTKFSSLDSHRLRSNEIRCPYCRTKQYSLLPYIEELNLPKQHGVNYIDLKEKPNIEDVRLGHCSWGDGNECNSYQVLKFASTNMDYCYHHYKQMCKKLLNDQKAAKKAEMMKQKQKLQKLNEQKKIEAKQKLQEEKALAKAAKVQEKNNNKKNKGINIVNMDENIVLSGSPVCQAILKSGVRKGEVCGCAVKINNYCTRHSKLVQMV